MEFDTINSTGIDAYYLGKELKTLYLLQFKRSNNHMLFVEELKALRDSGIKLVFNQSRLPEQSPLGDTISRLTQEISENKSAIDRVVLKMVFFGDPVEAEDSETLNGLIKQLPAYMQAKGSNFGIYAVLYFSGQHFDKPGETIPDLEFRLKNLASSVGLMDINIIAIDLSRPISPSKL